MSIKKTVTFTFQDNSTIEIKKTFLKAYPSCLFSTLMKDENYLEEEDSYYVDELPLCVKFFIEKNRCNFRSFDEVPRELLPTFLQTLRTFFPKSTDVQVRFKEYMESIFLTTCMDKGISIIDGPITYQTDYVILNYSNPNEWICNRLNGFQEFLIKRNVKYVQFILNTKTRYSLKALVSPSLLKYYPFIKGIIMQYQISGNEVIYSYNEGYINENNKLIPDNSYVHSITVHQWRDHPLDDVLSLLSGNEIKTVRNFSFYGKDIERFISFLHNMTYSYLRKFHIYTCEYNNCLEVIPKFLSFGCSLNITFFEETVFYKNNKYMTFIPEQTHDNPKDIEKIKIDISIFVDQLMDDYFRKDLIDTIYTFYDLISTITIYISKKKHAFETNPKCIQNFMEIQNINKDLIVTFISWNKF